MTELVSPSFADLGLAAPVLRAVEQAGYKVPTPIQLRTIPALLQGGDVLGQAQTGTGKTAAFTLPLLSRLAVRERGPAVLVLTPTRELAIQVAQAMKTYGQFIGGLRVLPIYGGASFVPQLRGLSGRTDVVVGTPGRVMDHMRRGTLDLGNLQALVLDEADEMLKMGFLQDVEWILERAPEEKQIALFSATMPTEIRRIAGRYLRNATHVVIEKATTTAETIRQRYVLCRGPQKVQTLAHLLEVEPTEGVLVFVRTRNATLEVTQALRELGHDGDALSGDVAQNQREDIVQRLRSGKLSLIVATDVAARGLDVSRISHVINFDMPDEPENYVHRIGRTGRAGRAGEAILLITPGEVRSLRRLEQATRQKLEPFVFPTRAELRTRRLEELKQKIKRVLVAEGIDELEAVVREVVLEQQVSPERIAAALIRELRAGEPLTPDYEPPLQLRPEARAPLRDAQARRGKAPVGRTAPGDGPPVGMDRYRMDVGSSHGVAPRHIVGAIAGESGLPGRDIGRVQIHDDYSLVDLPLGMPPQILRGLQRTWVAKRQLRLTKVAS
ncbi:MAG: DEAD/DEAH box helicase [Myxococcota bacterium]